MLHGDFAPPDRQRATAHATKASRQQSRMVTLDIINLVLVQSIALQSLADYGLNAAIAL
jgi:hypothetical protein